MISYLQALILGALQGLTELFPVSSLGHSVIAPALLGWNLDQNAPAFIILLVATHLATALVLVGFFYRDWLLIIGGIFRSIARGRIEPGDAYARLGWLLIAASIPAGLLGLLLQKKLGELFAAPAAAAGFLILNGLVLLAAELMRKKKDQGKENRVTAASAAAADDSPIAKLSWRGAFGIGVAQCLALIPGFSRTGVTLCGGLLADLDHESAARFSFLLAAPLILAAAVLKLPALFSAANSPEIGPIALGFLAAGIAAYLSVRFLVRYFKTRTLMPFAIYCLIAGLAFSVVFLVR